MVGRGGQYCAVPECKNNSYKCKTLSWHAFPVMKSLRQMWVDSIITFYGLTELNLKKNSTICSAHFSASDFRPLLHSKNKHLKKGVYPTIFPTTLYLIEEPQVNNSGTININQIATNLANKLNKPAADFSQPDSVIEAVTESRLINEQVTQTSVNTTQPSIATRKILSSASSVALKRGSASVVTKSCSTSTSVVAERDSFTTEIVAEHASASSDRSERECERCKELEEELSQLRWVLSQKDYQIEELKHGRLAL